MIVMMLVMIILFSQYVPYSTIKKEQAAAAAARGMCDAILGVHCLLACYPASEPREPPHRTNPQELEGAGRRKCIDVSPRQATHRIPDIEF
jgi:hypothetical protein